MADTLQNIYTAMISNCPAECGTIGIIVDTDAKTVTTVLTNPDSDYSVSGGGGLEYVIPEQTVTIVQNPADISITDLSGLQTNDVIVGKISKSDDTAAHYLSLVKQVDGILTGTYTKGTTIYGVDVVPSGNTADLYIYDATTEEDAPGTYTVSAVSAF